jgi:hypothetical protein
MSDTIRKQIIANIKTYLANVRRANAYETDIGQNVYLAQKAQIITPAIIIWPGTEQALREYGIDQHEMGFRVDGLHAYEINENPADISEDMLGDIIEIITGDKWTLPFTSGGTNRPNVGDTVTGADSGATAILESFEVSSGAWQDGDAAGTLTMRRLDGTFSAENLDIGDETNLASTSGVITRIESITLATNDLADDIVYTQGGDDEFSDQGNQTVGASAIFNIIYRTKTGNPYNQQT